jgi:iron complex outermembrane receptor protein
VLGEEELRLRRAATLGETLAAEPGINASHFGAGASRPVIRGMDGARVSVLSDGSELLDASTVSPDHAVTTEPLLANQIEVLRGPSALLYSPGAMGGVVNVLDGKIPTQVPEKGLEGSAEVQAGTAAGMSAGAFSLTTATPLKNDNGQLVLHAEGVARNAGDYRVGSGWGQSKVPGSFSRNTGSVGLSWVGNQGYLGLAYTRQRPGTACPAISTASKAATHMAIICIAAHDGHDHDHDHEESGSVPVVDLTSERWDLRGEWRKPTAGIAALRLRGGLTITATTRSRTAAWPPSSETRPMTCAWRWSMNPSPAGVARWVCRPSSAASAPRAKRPMCSPRTPSATASICWRNTAGRIGAFKGPCATTASVWRPS